MGKFETVLGKRTEYLQKSSQTASQVTVIGYVM